MNEHILRLARENAPCFIYSRHVLARQAALLQQFDTAVQELLYLGMRSEELRRRIPEGGTNHD